MQKVRQATALIDPKREFVHGFVLIVRRFDQELVLSQSWGCEEYGHHQDDKQTEVYLH